MAEGIPFLGTTSDPNRAFPGYSRIDLKIVQDQFGHYLREAWQRESHFTKANVPSHFSCANPRCQQGGLRLQSIILSHGPGTYKYYCHGHEGTPKGRRKGDPCDNSFELTLSFEKEKSA